MGSSASLPFEPTFTQGLITGQLSILILLVLVLRHLFFDSRAGRRLETPTYHPRLDQDEPTDSHASTKGTSFPEGFESVAWLNIISQSVLESYRSKLRNDLSGHAGDEVARRRIEEFVNKMRPANILDPIKVHAVDLGMSCPQLLNARPVTAHNTLDHAIEAHITYTDTASISLSTAVLVNFPKPGFARLPVSLNISLSLFASQLLIVPPTPGTSAPSLTLTVPPTFTLELKTTSLMGSRAKLADVPKLHELIQAQVRRLIAQRASWKVVLPGLASVAAVKEEVRKQSTGA